MCTTVANLSKLQMIQNNACRIILQVDKDTRIHSMHQELQLMTLKERRYYSNRMSQEYIQQLFGLK